MTDTLVDWSGVRHERAGRGVRIASLVPSLTELLFTLDLAESIVARTGFCVHPRDRVKRVPKIGGTKDVDLDHLRALAPTHLVVNVDENRREVVDAARAFVPTVVVTHPCAPDDNLRLYALFGAMFAREREADALSARYREARDALPPGGSPGRRRDRGREAAPQDPNARGQDHRARGGGR